MRKSTVSGWAALLLLAVMLAGGSGLAVAEENPEMVRQFRQVMDLIDALKYDEAVPLAKRYVARARQIHGEDHPEFALALSTLAHALEQLGKYEDSEPLRERILAVHEKLLGRDSPEVAFALGDLGKVFEKQGRFAMAEPLLKRALAIYEKKHGPEHRDVAQSLQWLIRFYEQQGRYTEALPIARRNLAIMESLLGPDHVEIAEPFRLLGEILSDLGHYAEAEVHILKAYEVRQKHLAPDNMSLNAVRGVLATVYEHQARFAEAEALRIQVLAIDEKVEGPDSLYAATAHNNLGLLHYKLGRYAEAESDHKRALAIRERIQGPNGREVGQSLSHLAQVYNAVGRATDAEVTYKRGLAAREAFLGPNHPLVAYSLCDLGQFLYEQGRPEEAEPLYLRCASIRETSLGPDHPELAVPLIILGDLYRSLKRYPEAEVLLKRSLTIQEKAFGPDHVELSFTLDHLGTLYHNLGRNQDALDVVRRALTLREKAFGPEHLMVQFALNNLGLAYKKVGNLDEAEKFLLQALSIQDKRSGVKVMDSAATLSNLSDLYYFQGNLGKAMEFGRRTVEVAVQQTLRGSADLGAARTGRSQTEVESYAWFFRNLVKFADRYAGKQPTERDALAREMFEIAQWAQSSGTAASLAQMAARGAKADGKLAGQARERQDLIADWEKRDAARTAAFALAPDKRNAPEEEANTRQLRAIERRIAEIDARLATDFPDYTALSRPRPLTIEETQKQLGPDEVLVLILPTPKWESMPEESFVWVVTKTEMRWIRSPLGSNALQYAVRQLRCGLDYDGGWSAEGATCAEDLEVTYTAEDRQAGRQLPFNATFAQALYNSLFAPAAELIKGRHVLISTAGPLAQLPFNVLLTAPPPKLVAGGPPSGPGKGWLGARLQDTSKDEVGIIVAEPVAGGPARTVGLKAGDILLALDGKTVDSVQMFVQEIQSRTPGSIAHLRLKRGGGELQLDVPLGRLVEEPHFMAADDMRDAAWFARSNAITMLPAVSSLQALRQHAKASQATKPLLGVGNPLLDGPNETFAERRRQAIANSNCGWTVPAKVVVASRGSASRVGRGVKPAVHRGGAVDVAQLRLAPPLPETANEVCDVAKAIGAAEADLLLGARATEGSIKQLSDSGALRQYRILHFATHGALAGEVSETAEPGLLLTPPVTGTKDDDGYLSASEIAALKLDAEWVILSACNTAGGDTKNADALSGLARAFFYAGARSLLVSHWYVDSEATVILIKNTIAELTAAPKLGRAEAVRRSILTMIATGSPARAHPSVWAPFIVVGEGGAGR